MHKCVNKKLIEHYQKAVHKCVNNGHNSQKYCKSRIVSSNVSSNGYSLNWRADWARLVGKTYAQVLNTTRSVKDDLRVHIEKSSPTKLIVNVNSNTKLVPLDIMLPQSVLLFSKTQKV